MSSPSYRYLHSAVFSGGLMLVYGGNTHNDTAFSQGAKCYSADFILYDVRCDRWMSSTVPVGDLDADLARFGHSAVLHNGSMIIHGGFHGLLRSDVLSFTPGSCELYKNKIACLQGSQKVGLKCAWDGKRETCERWDKHAKEGDKGMDVCPEVASVNNSHACNEITACTSCVSTSMGCVWCPGDGSCEWGSCSNTYLEAYGSSRGSGSRRIHSSSLSFSVSSLGLSSSLLGPSSSSDEPQTLTALEQCKEEGQRAVPSDWCRRLHTCHSCSAHDGCSWRTDGKVAKCREASPGRPTPKSTRRKKSGKDGESGDKKGDESASTCGTSCSERQSCHNCTRAQCMWCLNLNACIDRNAYLASYPYGQCMDWTTETDECPMAKGKKEDAGKEADKDVDNLCEGYQTCESCRSNPACGWCDDGTLTGMGKCMPGGASGPMTKAVSVNSQRSEWMPAPGLCPRESSHAWHFVDCPACQCNGHSNCSLSENLDVCSQPCAHKTEGEHCERCAEGYFGVATNGGTCEKCRCNGNAASCDHASGRCHCTTKGIIGDHCEKCDRVNHYYGDPVKDSCFCKCLADVVSQTCHAIAIHSFSDELAIDYQFTFNLSKVDDRHFTAINFKNTPTKTEVDVDFQITCSIPAKVSLLPLPLFDEAIVNFPRKSCF